MRYPNLAERIHLTTHTGLATDCVGEFGLVIEIRTPNLPPCPTVKTFGLCPLLTLECYDLYFSAAANNGQIIGPPDDMATAAIVSQAVRYLQNPKNTKPIAIAGYGLTEPHEGAREAALALLICAAINNRIQLQANPNWPGAIRAAIVSPVSLSELVAITKRDAGRVICPNLAMIDMAPLEPFLTEALLRAVHSGVFENAFTAAQAARLKLLVAGELDPNSPVFPRAKCGAQPIIDADFAARLPASAQVPAPAKLIP